MIAKYYKKRLHLQAFFVGGAKDYFANSPQTS
jgi:hypothetical protein